MNRWEFVPKMQSRNITLYAHLVTWNYTLRPFGLPIKKIKLGDVQKPQDQKDENDYKRWFVPQKNPKPKFICTQKNPLQNFFPQQFPGWGETTLWRYSHRSQRPLNAYPLTRSIYGGGQVEIQGDTPTKQNPWDQRIRSSADRSGGGNSNTYTWCNLMCIYIYKYYIYIYIIYRYIYGTLSYFFTPIFFGEDFNSFWLAHIFQRWLELQSPPSTGRKRKFPSIQWSWWDLMGCHVFSFQGG